MPLSALPTLLRASRPGRIAVLVAAVAHVASACYSEVPVRWQAAPETRDVDVTLDPAETAALAATLGPRARVLTGRVTARTDTTLTLVVTSVTRLNGGEESWPASEVALPARAVEQVTVRKLSAVRSLLMGAGILGATALIGTLASDASLSGGGGGRTPGRQ